MINIIVWSDKNIDIENETFTASSRDALAAMIMQILNKAYYSGETVCLETADIDMEKGKVNFTEIQRWK